MTETGLHSSSRGETRTAPISLPTQAVPSGQPGERRSMRDGDSLDETLTAGSTTQARPKSDDDSSDEDSIEMTSYRNRPQSPVDFTRTNAV